VENGRIPADGSSCDNPVPSKIGSRKRVKLTVLMSCESTVKTLRWFGAREDESDTKSKRAISFLLTK